MENQADSPGQFQGQPLQNNMQFPIPNSTGVLVLGILSIVMCCCYGIPGVILGIIALVLSHKANEYYMQNPAQYTQVSLSNLRAGKICAIVGLSISAIYAIIMVVYIIVYGFAAAGHPNNFSHDFYDF